MEATSERKYWYRIENRTESSGWDDFSEIGSGHHEVLKLWALPVLKHTPKGVWVDNFGQRKFVLLDSRKQYASPTKEAAMEAFKARKKRQISIINARLKSAQAALAVAEVADLEKLHEIRSSHIYLALEPTKRKAA